MDQATIERMVRARKTAAEELLMQAPIDGLDEVLTMLTRYCLTARIAGVLIEVLHCAQTARASARTGLPSRFSSGTSSSPDL